MTYRRRLARAYRNRRTRTANWLTKLRRAKRRGDKAEASRLRKGLHRSRAKLQYWRHRIRETESPAWGHCRGVTNTVVLIVAGRAPVTSRKRWATYGNPGSDHHKSQKDADAVDFGLAEAHALADEIARALGGPGDIDDYENFVITHRGRKFRVQCIAGTHGTGPHLHVGVRAL